MYFLKYTLNLPISLEQSWDFFSSPSNLKILTPKHLSFDMTWEIGQEKMYPGQMIGYHIRPLWNIPILWVTEITQVHAPYYFVDEQRIGPYKLWHHEHHFRSLPNGVEISDIVYYKMPFGFFGRIIHMLKIQKDLENIFSYRKQQLENLFGTYS